MIKRILLISISVLVLLIMASALNKSTGPPGCYAGEPPNFTNCTSCHSGQPDVGTAEITFDLGGAENGYVMNQAYTITVKVKKEGMKAAGFQAIALQNNNIAVSPGTFILTEPNRTKRIDRDHPHAHNCGIFDKVWITHRYQGILSNEQGESEWTYQWIAPSEYVGNITFYLAAMEADLDLTEEGDFTYLKTIVSPDLVTNNTGPEALERLISVYPNPAKDLVHVESRAHMLLSVQMHDLFGNTLLNVQAQDNNHNTKLSLDVAHLPNGIYYLVIKNINHTTVVRKMLLMR